MKEKKAKEAECEEMQSRLSYMEKEQEAMQTTVTETERANKALVEEIDNLKFQKEVDSDSDLGADNDALKRLEEELKSSLEEKSALQDRLQSMQSEVDAQTKGLQQEL